MRYRLRDEDCKWGQIANEFTVYLCLWNVPMLMFNCVYDIPYTWYVEWEIWMFVYVFFVWPNLFMTYVNVTHNGNDIHTQQILGTFWFVCGTIASNTFFLFLVFPYIFFPTQKFDFIFTDYSLLFIDLKACFPKCSTWLLFHVCLFDLCIIIITSYHFHSPQYIMYSVMLFLSVQLSF